MLGSFGALVCNSLGELFDAPVFIALAWFGYFLNLFNLTPVGMLDGGRIVTALSRWLWLPGFALLLWFGWNIRTFSSCLSFSFPFPAFYPSSARAPNENPPIIEFTPPRP